MMHAHFLAVSLGITAALTSLATDATPALTQGNGLYQACTGESAGRLVCLAYIRGVMEGTQFGALHGVTTATLVAKGVSFEEAKKGVGLVVEHPLGCQILWQWGMPDTANYEQAKDVVVNWLEEHPGERHLPSVGLIARSLNESWPPAFCSKE